MNSPVTLPRLFSHLPTPFAHCASILCLLAFTCLPNARADEENRRNQPENPRPREQANPPPANPEHRARYLHIAGDILEAGGFVRESRELHARAEEMAGDAAARRQRGRPERREEHRHHEGQEAEVDERINDLRRGVEAEMRELHEHVERSFGELREQTERELTEIHKAAGAELGELNERFEAEIGEVHKHMEAELGELHERVSELHELLGRVARHLEEEEKENDFDDDNDDDDDDERAERQERRERSGKKGKAKGR